MNIHSAQPEQIPSSSGILARMLAVIFLTETAVMVIFSNLFAQFDRVSAGIVDSLLLVLLSAPFLWFIVVRPFFAASGAGAAAPYATPPALFMKMLASVFLVQFVVMLALPVTLPLADPFTHNLLDASITTMLCAPLLWWLLFQHLPSSARGSAIELLATPLKLFGMLLIAIFTVDLLEILVMQVFPVTNELYRRIAEASVTTLIAAPFLWWLVVRPLRSMAMYEKSSSIAVRTQVVDAIVSMDAVGVVESFNPAAEEIFGYAAAGIVGKPATLLLCDDQQCLENLMQAASESETACQTHEIIGRRRDGSTLTMDVSISRVRLEGPHRFLMIMRDITGRKEAEKALRESEARFRQIFEQSEDAIIFFKPGTCSILDVNATTERLYGYTKGELQEGGLALICRPEDLDGLSSVISGIGHDGITRLDNIVNLRKDGTEMIVSVRGKMMTIQGVDVIYCTLRDITERMHMEEEARDFQARLIQANKMTSLGLLVSGVAHEINNPNNFIMANSQLLAKAWDDAFKILQEYYRENGEFLVGGIPFSELSEHTPEMFEGIVEGSRRINSIVNNLKHFARQDRIGVMRPVEVNRVVTTAVSLLHHELKKYTDNFHLDLAEDLPQARGSYQQLEQVVINLLLNACQALPGKEAGIRVVTGFDEATGQVTISVSDEGSGISREVGGRVLEPFFTTKLDSGGTGLGLSISQSIVREHNGTLEFDSEPGKGTTFTVKIPAAPPAVKEQTQ